MVLREGTIVEEGAFDELLTIKDGNLFEDVIQPAECSLNRSESNGPPAKEAAPHSRSNSKYFSSQAGVKPGYDSLSTSRHDSISAFLLSLSGVPS